MNPDIAAAMMSSIVGITALGCLTAVLITWLKSRGAKQLRVPELNGRLDEIAARLGELDHAIDTMAVEVERISEGQRFVSRVLAERQAAPVLPDRSRSGSTTPH
jgi:hypothetical protein